MSVAAVRAALETALAALRPDIDTVWENRAYPAPRGKPTAGIPYQRFNLLPARPDNLEIGASYFEQGTLQVTVCCPTQDGPGEAQDRGDLIRAAFFRGRNIISGGVTVLITHTPEIAAGYIDGEHFCIPVRARYRAEIQV